MSAQPSMRDAGFSRIERAPSEILGREIIAGHYFGATERVAFETKQEVMDAYQSGWSWWKWPF